MGSITNKDLAKKYVDNITFSKASLSGEKKDERMNERKVHACLYIHSNLLVLPQVCLLLKEHFSYRPSMPPGPYTWDF